MPATDLNLIDTLRRLAVATLAYAVAVGIIAGCMLPALLSTQAVAALLPQPPTVVARSPHPAPSLRAAL